MASKKHPPKPPDSRAPIAISYLRFSTPEQRKGDSTRRQTAGTETWCKVNGMTLDRSLSCQDAGRSAYHGKHRTDTKAALGNFLDLVQLGRIPRGSYLIIENLDRLSREDERTALRLWLDILDAGINIVQLTPLTVFRHEKSDMMDIMRAIVELSRGHSESRLKAERSKANWQAAIDRARQGQPMPPRRKDGRVTKVMTRRLPSWIEERNGLPRLIPERAAVVRRIYKMATAGLGAASIVKRLNAEKVPAFGDRETDEEGHWRAKEGEQFGCGEWRPSYVRQILKDRRVLGELQPRDRAGKAMGDPIPGYYPRVVKDREYNAARAAIGDRTLKPGRIGKNVANLFGGLLKNARDGSTYYAATRSDSYGLYRILLNQSAVDKEAKAKAFTFPYAVFEKAVLGQLRELKPEEVMPAADGAAPTITVLQQELNWLRRQKADLAAELLKGDVAVIAQALRQLETQEKELARDLEGAEAEVALPVVDTWKAAQSLAAMLDDCPADELEDLRLRLRAALRRIIDSVWVLVVPRGKYRLVALQIWFRTTDGSDPTMYRTYTIVHRMGAGGNVAPRAASTAVFSFKDWLDGSGWSLRQKDLLDHQDLRELKQALACEQALEAISKADLDRIMAQQEEK